MKIIDKNYLQTPEYRNAFINKMKGIAINEVEQRGLNLTNEGGAIPTAVADKLMLQMSRVAPVLEQITAYNVPEALNVMIYDTDGDPIIHEELTAISPEDDILQQINLKSFEVVKQIKVSNTVRTLGSIKFEDFLVTALSSDIAKKLEKIIFLGTGVAMPKGLAVAGSGTAGAYVEDTDLLTTAVGDSVAKADLVELVGMVAKYTDAAIYTSKETFLAYIHPLMNADGSIVTLSNGRYFVADLPVYFTDTLTKGIVYAAAMSQLVANYPAEIRIEYADVFRDYASLYMGYCQFDCEPIKGTGAFAKLVKAQA